MSKSISYFFNVEKSAFKIRNALYNNYTYFNYIVINFLYFFKIFILYFGYVLPKLNQKLVFRKNLTKRKKIKVCIII